MSVNRNNKDRFFKRVFSEKEALLSLYNAINDTDYTDPDLIEINTIEDFIFMTMKNDLSFVLANVLNLYEQQSTVNPNMSLRGFLYLSELYRKEFKGNDDIYSSKQVPLPTPQFVVFYIGTENEPDRREMRLSDAFMGKPVNKPAIECTATLLNINYGHNRELMEKCEKLKGYSMMVHLIRENIKNGMTMEKAVDKAVSECIRDGILEDILTKHLAEAKAMILEEYDEEKHIQNEKAISYEDGLNDGIKQGLEQGIEQERLRTYKTCLERGMSEEEAKVISGIMNETSEDIAPKHRVEAKAMILEEYDEEKHIQNEKAISYEDGLNDGIERGIERGIEQKLTEMITDALRRGKTCEEISEFMNVALEKVQEIEQDMRKNNQ